MCPLTHFSTVNYLVFPVLLLYDNTAGSRNSQMVGDSQIPRLSKENVEVERVQNEENKAILDVSIQRKRQLGPAIPCDCRDFCPAPNSSELEVSNGYLSF